MAEMIENLPSKHKTLNSNPVLTKKEKIKSNALQKIPVWYSHLN
jgi:hypothetical protein